MRPSWNNPPTRPWGLSRSPQACFSRSVSLSVNLVNDRGQLRSYRMDRIAGVRILDESFVPRCHVGF